MGSTRSFQMGSKICPQLIYLAAYFLFSSNYVLGSNQHLAKRWRFVWVDVPNLDFDSENHDTEAEFSDIINRVMLLYKVQRLDTFRLSYTDDCSSVYQLETWITNVIARNVQNLDLYLRYHVMLPRCLFNCKTLVDLRLHYCVGIPITDAECLPSLKKLHLYSVQYDVDETLPHLLSGCPVLEELIIEGIVDEDLVCCYISSPTIKRLTVDFQLDGLGSYGHDYTVDINAPALRYLQLQDCLSKHISARTPTSLIEADICFNNYKVEEDYFYTVLNFFD